MRRLMIAALSALILLCVSISPPQGREAPSIRWTPLVVNLLRGGAPSAQESISLESGKPVERELSGGQSHYYKISLTSGQYLREVVCQRGIDALVALFTPDGKKISEVTASGRPWGQRLSRRSQMRQDIYNLKLPADLVALSACQTGLGKEFKGEWLIGLARGFMYAGVPRIVASLWKVDDRATSELMKLFYQGMLGPERLSPAGALRQAQMSIWKQKQWRAPYYWAAFVLQGEWK